MELRKIQKNGVDIAVVYSPEYVITDTQSALDFMMTVKVETDCTRIVINKEAITADFFILSTCLAGEILQKFINYGVKIAIYGDFSAYTSKPLNDFIYESNRGNHIYFQPGIDQAVERLCFGEEKNGVPASQSGDLEPPL